MRFYFFSKQIRNYLFLGCVFIFTPISIAQHRDDSSTLIEEIIANCPVCIHDSNAFKQVQTDEFHNAHVYFFLDDIDTSFDLVSKLIERDTYEKPTLNYILYTLRGSILRDKLLYDEALNNFQTAITLGESFNSKHTQTLYTYIGEIYIIKEEYQNAVTILEKWKSNKQITTRGISENYHNLGLAYLFLKEYDKAEENLLASYNLTIESKDTLGLARSSLDIANLYYQQYKDTLALPYFIKGLDYAKRANDLEVLSNAYLNLAVVYENDGKHEKALGYRKEYEKVHDSIWNRDKIWQLAQTDKEIGLAAKQEKLNAEKWKKDVFITISVVFLVLLVIGSYLYYKTIRQNKIISKQKEDLNDLNVTKDKLFSVLTHDLKTPMYVLNKKLLNIQNSKTFTSLLHTKYSKLVTESYQISKNTILQIENTLHWILGTKNQLIFNIEKLHLNSVIDQVVYDYIPVINDKKIDLKKQGNDSVYINADLNSLKIVLRNVLDNAIKFSHPEGNILINIQERDLICELQIIDDGVGFSLDSQEPEETGSPLPAFQSSTKLGLRLSRDLVKKNKGTLKIQSAPNKGTTVSILLNANTD